LLHISTNNDSAPCKSNGKDRRFAYHNEPHCDEDRGNDGSQKIPYYCQPHAAIGMNAAIFVVP